jgi:hypothetical protein
MTCLFTNHTRKNSQDEKTVESAEEEEEKEKKINPKMNK